MRKRFPPEDGSSSRHWVSQGMRKQRAGPVCDRSRRKRSPLWLDEAEIIVLALVQDVVMVRLAIQEHEKMVAQ